MQGSFPWGPGNFPPDLWTRDERGNLIPYHHPQSLQSEPTHLRRARQGGGAFTEVAGDVTFTFDPHRYAFPLDQKVTLPAGQSIKILEKTTGFRNYLMFRNLSLTDAIYISFDQQASATSTLALLPGSTLYGEIIFYDTVVPQSDIWAFCAAAETLAFSYSTFNIPGLEPMS